MVPDVTVDKNSFSINGNNVALTLSWGEPFNNFDPIVNYTVSCSGDVTCPPNFTTTDNTTRSYTITNLAPGTNYTFSVVATNSIGSGEAGEVIITTPPGKHKSRRHIAPTIYDNTLLSGNSNAEHGKHSGTTAKRYPSFHAKTFLKLLHQNSKPVTSSTSYSKSYSTCLISFYHHPLNH